MSNELLIRCCAPTVARLKTGNMFNCTVVYLNCLSRGFPPERLTVAG